ncbi:hypothetical protein ACXIYA_005118, partial [Enterobacter hormaechei]
PPVYYNLQSDGFFFRSITFNVIKYFTGTITLNNDRVKTWHQKLADTPCCVYPALRQCLRQRTYRDCRLQIYLSYNEKQSLHQK